MAIEHDGQELIALSKADAVELMTYLDKDYHLHREHDAGCPEEE